jgi:hypothetical protein
MNISQDAVDAIEEAARDTTRWPKGKLWESHDFDRRFLALFGASPIVVAELWERIEPSINGDEVRFHCAKRKHLLWALVFLKVYGVNEYANCAIVGWPDVKTFRVWSWYFVEKLFDLQDDVIVWGNRFQGQPDLNDIQYDCMIAVDCLDCPCLEPSPFNTSIFSKKHNGPGIKYEVATCIKTGFIVWINGPFPAGNSEKTIFRNGLLLELEDWELVECDTGLEGVERARIPSQGISSGERKQKSQVRGRHENVNGKLKVFNVLDTYFHHTSEDRDRDVMLNKHGLCFGAVAVITQIKLASGDYILYDVEYDVHYS